MQGGSVVPSSIDRGGVIVVSAPSGAGKTTLCRRLLAELPDIEFSVSHTTRPPRAGERDGVDYHFVTAEAFEERRQRGEFIEWARVADHLYGTSSAALRQVTERGHDVLLDIDTQGAAAIRRLIPEAVHVFILPPAPEALRARLTGRHSETPESLARRLQLARDEVDKAPGYDFIVVNDDLEEAFDRLRSIVLGARSRRERQERRLGGILAAFRAWRP
jgi:guanylate kinase